MKLSKAQEQRRRDYLNDVLLDASGEGDAATIEACDRLLKLHPSQWDNHPDWAKVKAYVIDINPMNE